MRQYLPVLRRVPLFAGLEEEQLMEALECLAARVKCAAKAAAVFRAGEKAAALGCDEITLSFECERNAARNVDSPVPIGVIAYGRLPLMLLRNCPGKTAAGCGDCRGINHITDRRGEDFPLQCQNRQYTHLLNPRPLFLSDRLPEWDFCDFLTLRFTTETPAECDAILEMYQTGAAPAGSFTRGLYYRTLK